MSKNEKVLCYDSHIDPNASLCLDNLVRSKYLTWQYRGTCETDSRYKQIIPYVVFYDIKKDAFLGYQRLAGDTRLTGKISIGVGGHINEEDLALSSLNIIENNIRREVNEEIGTLIDIPADVWQYCRGLIYDPSDEVGRVHVGITFVIPCDLENFPMFGDTEHIFRVYDYSELSVAQAHNMENWSQIVYTNLFVYGGLTAHNGFIKLKKEKDKDEIYPTRD